MDAREQRLLAGVVQVVDRQRGHHRVPRPARQRVGEVGDDVAGRVAEDGARLLEHRSGTVEQRHLGVRMRAQHLAGEQAGARAEVEHAPQRVARRVRSAASAVP